MTNIKTYNSKVLLFGEYTVLHGSKALAIPFGNYHGQWIFKVNHPSRNEIAKLKQYLLKCFQEGSLKSFDFDQLERDISNGLAFQSNIPQGYGLGSSGSVTAAIYDRYALCDSQQPLTALKDALALIESCYHGQSSGLDPLVSFLNQPILIHNKSKIELLDRTNRLINQKLYLIDTNITRSTAPLVEAYLETRKMSDQFIMEMQEIAETNDELIDLYLSGDHASFGTIIRRLSALQFRTLKMLIPDNFIALWQEGLKTGAYSMKINGAGGGGFLMAYVHDSQYPIPQEWICVG